MHPEDIKAQLKKEYGTVRAFERRQGLPDSAVRDLLRGHTSRRTAVALAIALEKPITVLFPDRADLTRDDKSQKRDSHRLNGEAA